MANPSAARDVIELDVTGAPTADIDYWGLWPIAFFSLLLGLIFNAVPMLHKSSAPGPSPLLLWGLPALGGGIPIAAYLGFRVLQRARRQQAVPLAAYGATLLDAREAFQKLARSRGGPVKRRLLVVLNAAVALSLGISAIVNEVPIRKATGTGWSIFLCVALAVVLLMNAFRIGGRSSNAGAYLISVLMWIGGGFAFFLSLLGLFMLVGAAIGFLLGKPTWKFEVSELPWYLRLLGIAMFFLAMWVWDKILERFISPLMDRAAARSQPSAALEQTRDARSPVLFLRSFWDDQSSDSAGSHRLEEVVAAQVRRLGPFVAVGKPGELQLPGAARAYFKDTEWRDAVMAWMDRAQFIVMFVGLTDGLQWELQTLIEKRHEHKLVLILPPGQQHHKARCDWVRACFTNTPWGPALARANLAKARAIHLQVGNALVVINSAQGSVDETRAAVVVAIFGLSRSPC